VVPLCVYESMHGESAVCSSSNFEPEVLWLDIGTAHAPEPFGPLERFGDIVDLYGENNPLRPHSGHAAAETGLADADEVVGPAAVSIHRCEPSVPDRPPEHLPIELRQTVCVDRSDLEVHDSAGHRVPLSDLRSTPE
jgi:hypothetical protein